MENRKYEDGVVFEVSGTRYIITTDKNGYPDLLEGVSLKDGKAKSTTEKLLKELGYEQKLEEKGKELTTHELINLLKRELKDVK